MFSLFLQNYQLYKIAFVDAGKNPVLYKLVDLKDDAVPGHYYYEQLTFCRNPDPGKFFHVEKILRKRWVKNEKQYLVKYLHYPPKFNRWVVANDMLK